MSYRFWAVKLENTNRKIIYISNAAFAQLIMHPAIGIYVNVKIIIDGNSSRRLDLLQWRLLLTISSVERVLEAVRLQPPHCLHRGHASAPRSAPTVVRRRSPPTQCAQAISSAPRLSATGKVPSPTLTPPVCTAASLRSSGTIQRLHDRNSSRV